MSDVFRRSAIRPEQVPDLVASRRTTSALSASALEARSCQASVEGDGSRPFARDLLGVPAQSLPVSRAGDAAEREAERLSAEFSPQAPRMRRCACGGIAGPDGACARCRARHAGAPPPVGVPRAVSEVIRQPGHEVDAATVASLQPAFSDVAAVRIHDDGRAAVSAAGLEAKAYTVGNHIVFGRGQYQPASGSGRRLLAHELVHVAQQRALGAAAIQRQSSRSSNAPDQQAQAIITAAQDSSVTLDRRAIQAVRSIISTYYSAQSSKIHDVVYNESESGLLTTSVGRGASTTGTISVGRYFVEHTTRSEFARRVLQVGHELQHVDQYRTGLAGATNRHLREFLAFHWEATATEAAGTGRMSHATRVSLIDGALGHYNCLDDQTKRDQQTKQQELLTLRASEQHRGGNDPTSPPTACQG